MIVLVAQACAADDPPGSHSHTVHSCSPNYIDENKLGGLSVQQKGPGTSIQWGAYPKLPADKYVVDIYIGSKAVDGKRQSYPPHGSLPPRVWNPQKHRSERTYRPGQIFKISGTLHSRRKRCAEVLHKVQAGVMAGVVMETWTEDRIRTACSWVQHRLEADFAGTELPPIEFRVDPGWQERRRHASSGRARPEDVIVVCGGHEFPLHLEAGVESACGYAAYQLQDDVIGEHGQAWPELLDGAGGFVGVLAPPADIDGLARWDLRGEPFCAVGHLHQACEAAGLTIRPWAAR